MEGQAQNNLPLLLFQSWGHKNALNVEGVFHVGDEFGLYKINIDDDVMFFGGRWVSFLNLSGLPSVSNNLDPDQTWHFVESDLCSTVGTRSEGV